jgi:hypothetical protein
MTFRISIPVARTAILLCGAGLAAAQNTPSPAAKSSAPRVAATKPAPKVAEPKRHPDGRPSGVPYDAEKIAPATWRALEKGKPVIYRQTAFGFAKLSEEENAKIQRMIDGKPDPKTDIPPGMNVVEKDGKLHFSRTTPFGPYSWVKEKTDLNPVETALWQQLQKTSAKSPEVRR